MAHSHELHTKYVTGELVNNEQGDDNDDEHSFSYAMQLATSTVMSMSLQTATELGIFDIINRAGAKLSATEIATELGCRNPEAPTALDRLLRLLASHSVLRCSVVADNESEEGSGSFRRVYGLAPVARFYVPNANGASLGPYIKAIQDKVFLESWSQMKNSILEGGVAFDRVHGSHAFEYPGLDPRFNEIFNEAMVNHTIIVMNKILECYKGFEKIKTLVDVAGGLGITLKLITSKYHHIHGINFDLPHVIQNASSYPGVEHVGGDMFESVPKGDAIFMKWILHDWSDERCLKLLKNCYDAIPQEGKVIVVDAVYPITPHTSSAMKYLSQLDIHMLTQNLGGKERSEQEFNDLAKLAGFSGVRYECFICNLCVMEFFK